jgi:hypothetical protein
MTRAAHRSRRAAALAVAGLSAAAILAAPSGASTSAPVVTETSLTPGYVTAGHAAAGTLQIAASSPVAAEAVGIAVRSANGTSYDFPGAATNVNLGANTYVFTSGTRTFPAGTYTEYGFWEDTSGTYHSLPSTTLTVGAAPSSGVSELAISPAYTTAGASLTGALQLSSSTSVTARSVGIAVRDSNGNQYDFPGAATNVGLGKTTYAYNSGSTTFPAGNYTEFGFWQDSSGNYHDLTSTVLTVGAALPPSSPPVSAPVPVGVPGTWHVVMDDEFNATSLDTSIWQAGWFGSGITSPANSNEQACYNSNNVTLPGDGTVHLRVTDVPATCGGKTEPYTGALLSSNPSDGRASGGFQYTYGVVEARVYLPPAANGEIANWPAVWADGQSPWPTNGEDDVLEGLGGEACFHFHSPSGGPGSCVGGNLSGWHTFASDWQPGSVTYYYDGAQVGRITTGITSSPMYLILSNTVSSAMGGPTVAPSDMQVDYVRVWQ